MAISTVDDVRRALDEVLPVVLGQVCAASGAEVPGVLAGKVVGREDEVTAVAALYVECVKQEVPPGVVELCRCLHVVVYALWRHDVEDAPWDQAANGGRPSPTEMLAVSALDEVLERCDGAVDELRGQVVAGLLRTGVAPEVVGAVADTVVADGRAL